MFFKISVRIPLPSTYSCHQKYHKINLFLVKSEVIYLLEHLDLDRSKDLSMPEILNGSETFLASQMTYFGKIKEFFCYPGMFCFLY